MADQQIDLVTIDLSANMRYLLGFPPLQDEQLCLLLVSGMVVRFVIPDLNTDQVEAGTGMQVTRGGAKSSSQFDHALVVKT